MPFSQSVSAKRKPSLKLNLTLILTLTLTLILLVLTPLNPTNSNSNSKTMKFTSFRRKSPQHPPQTTPCFQGWCRPTSGNILIIHQVALWRNWRPHVYCVPRPVPSVLVLLLIAILRQSVCHTLQYCVRTTEAIIRQSTLYGDSLGISSSLRGCLKNMRALYWQPGSDHLQ